MGSTRPFDPSLPVINIDFQLKTHHCSDLTDCQEYAEHLLGMGESERCYLGVGAVRDNQLIVACINLRDLTYENYLTKVRKKYKGNVIREARKADKLGYVCKPFVRKLFIPDIVVINHSKEVRSCGIMPASYRRTIDDLGGAPCRFVDLELPVCSEHYGIMWGIFAPEPGYRQGSVLTNERLLAYIRLRRIGNFATYSIIIGHGDYLQQGIMYRLHFTIMEWLCHRDNKYAQGLDVLMYAGFYDGSDGLILWKKKTGFAPAYLVVQGEEALPAT